MRLGRRAREVRRGAGILRVLRKHLYNKLSPHTMPNWVRRDLIVLVVVLAVRIPHSHIGQSYVQRTRTRPTLLQFSVSIEDPKAFNVQDFFPTADQGSILITSRLASLYHLGTDMKVKPVNQLQGESILEKCLRQSMQGQCNKKHTCSGII